MVVNLAFQSWDAYSMRSIVGTIQEATGFLEHGVLPIGCGVKAPLPVHLTVLAHVHWATATNRRWRHRLGP